MATATESASAMNLHQKLIELRKSIPKLKKDKKGHNYSFVSGEQILKAVRPLMDKLNLLLIPNVTGFDVRERKTAKTNTQTGVIKESSEFLTNLSLEYVWINADNPEETLSAKFFSQGIDSQDKGAGMALTYGERYFYMKFFGLSTDEDDPDNYGHGSPPPRNQQRNNSAGQAGRSSGDKRASEAQIKKIFAETDKLYKIDHAQTLTVISEYIGLNLTTMNNLTVRQASDVITGLMNDDPNFVPIVQSVKG